MALFLRSLILSRGSALFFYYIAAQRCLIDISHADTRPNPLGLSWFFYWFRCRLSSHLSVPHFLTRSLAPPATQVAIRLDGGQCLGISQITKRDLEVRKQETTKKQKNGGNNDTSANYPRETQIQNATEYIPRVDLERGHDSRCDA